jgi:hypothetical protein
VATGGIASGALALSTNGQELFFGVYYGNPPGLWSASFDGSRGGEIASLPNIQWVAADSDYVYSNAFGPGGHYGPGIYQTSIDGGADAGPAYHLAAVQVGPLVVDNGHLYFTEPLNGSVQEATSATLDSPRTVCAKSVSTGFLLLDASNVYFDDTQGHLFSCPRTPGAASPVDITPLGQTVSGPFIVDDTHVYAFGGRQIVRFNKDGSGGWKKLVTLIDTSYAAVDDPTAVYFTTYGSQTTAPYAAVWRMAK